MHGLQPLLAFSETAKRGGFAAAARELGTAPSTLAKAVGMAQAAVLGLGLAQVPDYMAADDLATGRLVEVLKPFRPPAMPIHAVIPGNRMVPGRVRVVLDAVSDLSSGLSGAGASPVPAKPRKKPAESDRPPHSQRTRKR